MLDEERIKELTILMKQPVKDIKQDGQMTFVEFEDGQILPLYGGTAGLEGLQSSFHSCSFCGTIGTNEKPVVSLSEKNEPLICSNCVTIAVQLFVQNGVEIELDITDAVSEEMIDKIMDIKK
ncbi:MAG: hypothetical protein K0R18_440 [Bacillales bacterium]|jgi:hypothetical protein|nr:hypothetical protein [Bacillales bacterium]